jgi:plastocyanin
MIVGIFLAAFGMASCLASPALAGTIRGVVSASERPGGSPHRFNPYPGSAQSMQPAPFMRGVVTDAVVYVDGPVSSRGARPGSEAHPLEGGRLAQKGQSFMPRVLPIAVGSKVDFPNMDPIYHNVFSVSPTKRFDLGKYGRGKSKSLVFDKVGLVNVYCDIHSNMEGFILVLPNRWFTQPAPDGSFELKSLPAGTYRIKAWHPDLGERVVSVTVGENEVRTVEIAF